MQQFYIVIQYNEITLILLLKGYILTSCSLCAYSNASVIVQGDKIH